MYKFVVTLLILLNITPVYAVFVASTGNSLYNNGFNSRLRMNQPRTTIASYNAKPRRNNLYPPHCPGCHYNNPYLSRSDLNALERYAMNRTYRRENELQRLERLENLAFGAVQTGNPITRYRNVENAILSRPQYGARRSVLGNIANYFTGQATGFTPSITSYPTYGSLGGFSSNPYMFTPNYNNNTFEQYSNGIFGGGWGMSGNNFGTGSSIRMLD